MFPERDLLKNQNRWISNSRNWWPDVGLFQMKSLDIFMVDLGVGILEPLDPLSHPTHIKDWDALIWNRWKSTLPISTPDFYWFLPIWTCHDRIGNTEVTCLKTTLLKRFWDKPILTTVILWVTVESYDSLPNGGWDFTDGYEEIQSIRDKLKCNIDACTNLAIMRSFTFAPKNPQGRSIVTRTFIVHCKNR